MNFLGSENYILRSSSSAEEEFLIRQILLSHDPDGRHLDSELLLRASENIMSYATISEASDQDFGSNIAKTSDVCNIEVDGSEEPLGHTVYKVSRKMLCNCFESGNAHGKTMALFDMLENYRWDAKAALALSAFATIYGEFWLIMQLCPCNPLAASLALLKQLPNDLSLLRPRFKALLLLVKTIVEVTKSIIKFERFPVQRIILDNEAISITQSEIYMATYWVIRSALTCSFQITGLKTMKLSKDSNSTTIATWELFSVVRRLSTISSRLRQQVDAACQLIEANMHNKLLNLFEETHNDNQEVLDMLFSLKHNLPLKDSSSQAKVGLSVLKDKVVILLVSRPKLIPIDVLFLLVHQMFDHPHLLKLEGNLEILWVPIPASDMWTDAEEESFEFLSNSLPWYSIRQPWLLNSIVVEFIKQAWNFKEDPLMVALNTQGKVTNSNAIDMTLIWGAMAYPFSIEREKELWEEETWNLQLLLDRIDPLVANWVEKDQNLCIYGSDNIDWIKEFTAKMRKIIRSGLQLKMVYVGKKNPSEHVRNILASMDEEKLTCSLTLTKINFFWLRLESMRRSKHRLGHIDSKDQILKQLLGLLDHTEESEKGWVLMGRGSSTDTILLQGAKIMECLDLFPVWGDNVGMLGVVTAIRTAIEPPLPADQPCHHTNIIPFVEGLKEIVFCEKCKHPMEKFVVYKCDVTE